MPAIVAAAVIGGVSTVAGAATSANATKKASQAAQDAADKNNALQASIYQQNRELLSPYVDRGNTASNALMALYGLGGDPTAARDAFNTYLGSTGYQFQLDQGLKAITGQQATAGMLNSGKTLKALSDYGQDTARSWFDNYASGIAGLADSGQSAASAVAGVGTNYANQVSANNNNAADAKGNAALTNAANINHLLSAGVTALGRGMSSFNPG